ncbi:hypothetical protein ABZ608_39365 [Streptomyces sp. NPDC013172]|uniref:hypothetical protein n=1 Tax=Streptomyces sp. NPDC013172 TaxID=3155009 RepID=UPI003401BC09
MPLLIEPGVVTDAGTRYLVVNGWTWPDRFTCSRRGGRHIGALGPNYPLLTEIDSVGQVLKLIAADKGTEPGPFVWSFRRLVVLEGAAQRHSRGTSELPPIPARSSDTTAAYGAGHYRLAANLQRFSATTTNIPGCDGLHARWDT